MVVNSRHNDLIWLLARGYAREIIKVWKKMSASMDHHFEILEAIPHAMSVFALYMRGCYVWVHSPFAEIFDTALTPAMLFLCTCG